MGGESQQIQEDAPSPSPPPNPTIGVLPEENDEVKEMMKEAKKQMWLAGPLISVNVSQYLLQMISLMFVGHLGELPLSGASMASSFTQVTGFTVLMGIASALETLCGQSYGAKQYGLLCIHMQRAMLVLLIASIPLTIIWANTESILKICGQDDDIAHEAGVYASSMIPSLFAYGFLQALTRFLQAQNIVWPMMISSGITTLLHILVCWLLVVKTSLGIEGAAFANCISYWLNAILLVLYARFSSSCSETWAGFSKEALHNILNFLKLAVPSAVMVCLEMWSFEMMVLLSGLLPNPKLQTSVLSICLNTSLTVWMIPVGLSGAVSTRVSNELGAGYPQAARMAVVVASLLVIMEGILMGSILIFIRNVWGFAYNNKKEVVSYVGEMMPILALSNFLDGFQCVLSGNARGCGLQKIGAAINLSSYYIVGIPTAILLAFVFHVGGKGLWLGLASGLVVQVTLLLTLTIRIDWEKQVEKATEVYEIIPSFDVLS